MTVEIFLPKIDESIIASSLRELTKVLAEKGHEISGGLLGGEFGYGAYYENDVFMMHPYCWCEQMGCGWCNPKCKICGGYAWVDDSWDFAAEKGWENPAKECGCVNPDAESNPNFHFKGNDQTEFKVWWYKYIGRSMQFSRDSIDLNEWLTIVQKCLASV